MADKTTTLKTKTNDNVYPNVIGDNRDNAISDSPQIKHTLTAEHKINFRLDTNVNNLINNSLQKPAGLTKTKLVGVGSNGQENIEIGDNLTLANGKLSATGGGGSISVIELTDKNGTIASTQLGEIIANPQNFTFKYKGNILLFTKADSTTYQYCNNTTSSSDNNVMTTSILLTITSSTGVYTIAENVHNVVANSIHPANGGDLTNIQVGSKVYSIPSGGSSEIKSEYTDLKINAKSYEVGDYVVKTIRASTYGAEKIYSMNYGLLGGSLDFNIKGDCKFIPLTYNDQSFNRYVVVGLVCIKAGTVSSDASVRIEAYFILK